MKNSDYNGALNFPGMGIYVINRDVMIKLLAEYFPTANDLKSQVISGAISLGMKVASFSCKSITSHAACFIQFFITQSLNLNFLQMHGYQFDGYWEDMRSIEAYYRANMETIRRANKAYKSVTPNSMSMIHNSH